MRVVGATGGIVSVTIGCLDRGRMPREATIKKPG